MTVLDLCMLIYSGGQISALLVAKWKYIGQGEFVSTSPGIFKTFHYGVFVI